MDFEIHNIAPEADIVHIVFGKNPDSSVAVSVEREESGEVTILVVDNFDGSERRIVLGQPGYTDKL